MATISIQRCSASKLAGHCQNYAPCAQSVHTRGYVAATYPWDKYPQHFHVCANVVILSLLHVPATRRCFLSPQCVLHKFLSLQHVAVTRLCNMTPRVCPPYNIMRVISQSSMLTRSLNANVKNNRERTHRISVVLSNAKLCTCWLLWYVRSLLFSHISI